MAAGASDPSVDVRQPEPAIHYKKMYDRVSSLGKIGVWECDLATEQLTWTDTVYDLFDIPRGAPIERSEILHYYQPESRQRMERLRAEAIQVGGGFSLDIHIRTAKNNERWIRLTADVEQEDGRSVRIFGTKQDISDQRAAQEQVQSLQKELIHVSRVSAMSTMASTLAHELNQPLTAVSNYIAAAKRFAERQKVTPDLARCIVNAGQSALRAGEIIRSMRDMTVGGIARKATLDIEETVRDPVALALAGHPNMTVECDLRARSVVEADRIQIQQVLLNLLQNACEAAAGNRCKVTIRARDADGHLEICVSDDGPGIPEEILPRIFDSLVTTKPAGMGIGLSVSRTIVEAHGGSITARNTPGGGATVCFRLPARA